MSYEYEESILRLQSQQRDYEAAQEKAKAAKEAYERVVRETQEALPRITPRLIALFKKFEEAEDCGAIDLDHQPQAWSVMVQIGLLINPSRWERWNFEDEEDE